MCLVPYFIGKSFITTLLFPTVELNFFVPQVSGFVADGMGRKKFFYLAAFFHIIGSIIQLVSSQFAALVAGRIITGSTVG